MIPLYVFYDPSSDCENCPENVLMIKDSQTAVDIAGTAINLIGIVLVVARAPQPRAPLAPRHAGRAAALHARCTPRASR